MCLVLYVHCVAFNPPRCGHVCRSTHLKYSRSVVTCALLQSYCSTYSIVSNGEVQTKEDYRNVVANLIIQCIVRYLHFILLQSYIIQLWKVNSMSEHLLWPLLPLSGGLLPNKLHVLLPV